MISREEIKDKYGWVNSDFDNIIIDEIYDSIGSCGECKHKGYDACPYDPEYTPRIDFYCADFERKD